MAGRAARATRRAIGKAARRIAHELVPQGTLIERVRAGGAGLAAFYTPTGVGTAVAQGKEIRTFAGRAFVLETALRADFALIRAARADGHGNLCYRGAGRNYNPALATAARVAIAEVDDIVDAGTLDPELVVTPGIFIDRLVLGTHLSHGTWDSEGLLSTIPAIATALELLSSDRMPRPTVVVPV